jgi:hypothetical protein
MEKAVKSTLVLFSTPLLMNFCLSINLVENISHSSYRQSGDF